MDVASLPSSELGPNADLEDAVYEKRVMRKIDKHLIPWLALLYLLSFLDRYASSPARSLAARLTPLTPPKHEYRLALISAAGNVTS